MTRKAVFFEGWSWFKFNNFKLALGTNLKFYISVAKELKGNVRKFLGQVPTFVEVTREKLVGGRYAQAFGFKTFQIGSPVLTSLSHENTIETFLRTPRSCSFGKLT